MPDKRVGIFGGVFDPVHLGHLKLAETALSALFLSKLYVIPCGIPAHKKPPYFSSDDRLLFLRTAFHSEPRIEVSDMEIKRAGVSYTIDTVEVIGKKEGVRPFFLIGADNLSEMASWRTPEKIFEQAQVVVMTRPGFDPLDSFPAYRGKILALPMPPMAVSSSEIRNRLKQGESVQEFLPQSIQKYF